MCLFPHWDHLVWSRCTDGGYVHRACHDVVFSCLVVTRRDVKLHDSYGTIISPCFVLTQHGTTHLCKSHHNCAALTCPMTGCEMWHNTTQHEISCYDATWHNIFRSWNLMTFLFLFIHFLPLIQSQIVDQQRFPLLHPVQNGEPGLCNFWSNSSCHYSRLITTGEG